MRKSMGRKANPVGIRAKPPDESGPELRWDELAIVLALARAGSLSGAAERLGVNISTVARRLDGLEAKLHVHLFDRTPTGVVATEMAEALIPAAETMERAAADAMRVLAGRETEPEGVVRIAAPPGLANWIVAPGLVKLRARHPKLRIELLASVGYVDLTRREADLAIRAVRPQAGDLVSVRLIEVAPVVAGAASLVRRVGRLKDLDAVDWVTWGPDLAHLPDAEWIAKHVARERIVLQTSSMATYTVRPVPAVGE